MSIEVSGGCLCGAVRFSARVPARAVRPCACTQCMRQNGGPWFAVAGADPMEWRGEIATFRASAWATRGFCPVCGSTLFWQKDGGLPELSHGALDDRDGWRLLPSEHEDTLPDAFRIVPGTGDAS